MEIACIEHHFSDLEDPRVDWTNLRKLLDIVVMVICAIICGAETYIEIESVGQAKQVAQDLPGIAQWHPVL